MRSELKLRLLYNLLAFGNGSKNRLSAPESILFSGLSERTAYNYINQLVAEGALRRIGKSPAIYETTATGLRYKSELGQNSARNFSGNFSKPSIAGGRGTSSHDKAVGTPSSPSLSDKVVDEAKPEPVAGPEPGPEQEPGQSSKAGQEGQDGAKAGPEAAGMDTPGQAGQVEAVAKDEAHEEDVRPAPPVALDHFARVHHRAVKFTIQQGACRRPELDLLRWGTPIKNVHGDDWYKPAEVLFDDIGIVTLQEFPGHCIRIWLPEESVHDRQALQEALGRDLEEDALRVANWLQKNYGYQFGLPEPDELHVAFPLPDIGGTFKGWLKIKADDGTTITIDQSKKYAEIEFLLRPAQRSEGLRKILNWANAPTLLTALQDELYGLEKKLPSIMKGIATETFQEAMPALADVIADKVEKAITPKIEVTVQAAMGASQEYKPPPGPGDNIGYG